MEYQNTEKPMALPEAPNQTTQKKSKSLPIIAIVIFLLISVALVFFMVKTDAATSELIKNIFIVVFAMQSVLIVIALVILLAQAAQLINLLKIEVKPILTTANETARNVKGTVEFLGDNMVEPAIKANSTIAGVTKVFSILSTNLFNKRS